MSVVNYTVEHNAVEGWAKVEWEFSSSGETSPFPNQDEGQPFDCTGMVIDAMVASGDFGGVNDNGQVAVLASHEITPSIFRELFTFTRNNYTGLQSELNRVHLKQVKPVYNRNNRTVTVAVLLRRASA